MFDNGEADEIRPSCMDQFVDGERFLIDILK